MENIYSLFCKQVKRNPDKLALVFENENMNYNQLYEASIYEANNFSQRKIVAGDIVIIYLPNSIRTIIYMLGLLKIGAIILPLDTYIPLSRLEQIYISSGTKMIICQENITSNIIPKGCLFQEEGDLEYRPNKGENIEIYYNLTDLAFCIYTSGSTGNPKGVLLTHTGIINHMNEKIKVLDLKNNSKICLSLSLSFVASIWQLFTPLILGATLFIYQAELIKSPYRFFERINRDQISVISILPQFLQAYCMLVEQGHHKFPLVHLKKIVLTGEKLHSNIVKECYNLYEIPLINGYGQSECSDDTFHYIIPYDNIEDNIPIGYPSKDITTLILNPNNNNVADNEQGELCIGGICLARGYLNDRALTAEKFIIDPRSGMRMFKTGDLVRRSKLGVFYYDGRADNQIKIRGHRVEPEEIEYLICQYPDIQRAVVQPIQAEEGVKWLSAFYTSEISINANELKKFLIKILPYYMVPVTYTKVREFCYTETGKLSRAKEHIVQIQEHKTRESLGEKLSGIERKVIQILEANIDSSFSLTLDTELDSVGLNSIHFIKTVVALEKEFEIVFDESMLDYRDYIAVSDLVQYIASEIL